MQILYKDCGFQPNNLRSDMNHSSAYFLSRIVKGTIAKTKGYIQVRDMVSYTLGTVVNVYILFSSSSIQFRVPIFYVN